MKSTDSTARAKPAEPDARHPADPASTSPDVTSESRTRPAPDAKPAPDTNTASDTRPVPVAKSAPEARPAPEAEPPEAAPVREPAASPAAEIDRLGRRMDRAVGGFVDDPRRAVREADAVLDETVSRLAALVEERQRKLRASWDPKDDGNGNGNGSANGAGPGHPRPDTEELRVALTRYRDLTRQLLSI